MESSGASPLSGSGSFSGSSSSNDVEMDQSGDHGTEPLDVLAQGTAVVIRMKPKSLLCYIMQALGSPTEPLFSEINAGENGFKYSVKLDVSGLRSVTGDRISQSVVVGEPSVNRCIAKMNAASNALKHLHEKHRIKVLDFSSRVADRLDSYNSYDLVIDGIRSLEKIFAEWEMTCGSCENFAVSIEGKQFDEVVAGELNDKGHVFALCGNRFTSALTELNLRTSEARSEMDEIKNDIRNYEHRMALKGQMMLTKGHFHSVDLCSKDVLGYVLAFLRLDDPKYSIRPGADGYVHSEVKLIFPPMDMYQYGGPITISGHGATSVEANEHAALEALLFIEKHFPIKIVDCNYSKRKKATKLQTYLVLMLSKIIDLGDQLKKMWCNLSAEISAEHDLLGLDATSLFSGGMAQGQIDAYNFCARGFQEIGKKHAIGYASCSSEFQMMLKLTWQLVSLKINLHK